MEDDILFNFDPVERCCFDLTISEMMIKRAEISPQDIAAAEVVANYMSAGNTYMMSVYYMYKHWWNGCNLKNVRFLVEEKNENT
jgi:hypothetical protein